MKCPLAPWWWPWHRWRFDGPCSMSVAPCYIVKCKRCLVRRTVVG